jgi:prephenate dehydratase
VRIALLGPAGTFSEEALLAAAGGAELELSPKPTIPDAIEAVERGECERGFVPFENSTEGAVRATLDALAFDTERTRIVGEHDHSIHQHLLARRELPLEQVGVVLSHPQASAQCARFLRRELPGAEVRPAASTAEAARLVASSPEPWAALGSAAAARAHGCAILREQIEDVPGNVTRFVWLAREQPERAGGGDGETWRTTLVFHELGSDRPGALVEALEEFASRAVNLTRIESRPLRQGLGRYLFFIDIEGGLDSGSVGEAVAGLRGKAESVRILGSYPVGGSPPLG